MESLTYLKNIRLSPKKLRYYLKEIKNMGPAESLKKLFYGKQKATRIMYQAIKSAISNAKSSLKTESDLLDFKLLTIEEGQIFKRYRPGARGNVRPIKKRTSHIKIILAKKGMVNEAPIEKQTEEKKPALKVAQKSLPKSKKKKQNKVNGTKS